MQLCTLCQDDGYIPSNMEKQIFETMAKIRKRDSSIYDSSKHFFAEAPEVTDQQQASRGGKKNKEKPMLLKDVIAQQVQIKQWLLRDHPAIVLLSSILPRYELWH